jgi:hypothetical protein
VPELAVKIAQNTDAHVSINRTPYFFGLRLGVAERALAVAIRRRASSRSGLVCWIISFSRLPVIFAGTPASGRGGPAAERRRLDFFIDLSRGPSRNAADLRESDQLLETGGDFGAPQPRQRDQDIGDIGIEVVGRREGPRSFGFIVEKRVIAAVVVAVGGEQIEDGATEAFARLFRAPRVRADRMNSSLSI